ncbi:hypothetical protein [Synechococcus elongatus]|uniref:hypothetical protein n=1 Tax=Synechococcus elongatus TaxID=32046 RepID=UPI000F7F3200|nr:hypothetical protein [Synechococcus elongatus]
MARRWVHKKRNSSDRGYILGIVIVLALVLGVSVAALALRSAGEKAGSSQRNSVDLSLSAAEIGQDRLFANLNGVFGPYASAAFPDTTTGVATTATRSWAQLRTVLTSGGTANANPCSTPTPDFNILTTVGTSTLGNSGQLSWQLVSYKPQANNTARVVMRGFQGTSSSNIRTEVERTYATRRVTAFNTASTFPALLTGSVTLGNNDVISVVDPNTGQSVCNANVYCLTCTGINNFGQNPQSVVDGDLVYRATTPDADGNSLLSNGIDWNQNTNFPAPKVWPGYPTIPIPFSAVTNLQIAALFAAPSSTLNPGFYNDLGGRVSPSNPLDLRLNPDITGSITLPRSTDVVGANGAYNYLVRDVTTNGNEFIRVNTPGCEGVTPVPTSTCKPVYLYVVGDVNADFLHTNSPTGTTTVNEPEDFVIFGRPGDYTASGIDQTITINGGSRVTSALVVAPRARVGVNGGSNNPDFYGAVWSKEWNGSSSNNVEIVVPLDIAERAREFYNSPRPTVLRLNFLDIWRAGGTFNP